MEVGSDLNLYINGSTIVGSYSEIVQRKANKSYWIMRLILQ